MKVTSFNGLHLMSDSKKVAKSAIEDDKRAVKQVKTLDQLGYEVLIDNNNDNSNEVTRLILAKPIEKSKKGKFDTYMYMNQAYVADSKPKDYQQSLLSMLNGLTMQLLKDQSYKLNKVANSFESIPNQINNVQKALNEVV